MPVGLPVSVRVLFILLCVVLLSLQYRLWVGEGSMAKVHQLASQIAAQRAENAKLQERNRILEAEVVGLKEGMDAIEARARSELGMIKEGEIFYQIVE
jgi:cell division protein FtsB